METPRRLAVQRVDRSDISVLAGISEDEQTIRVLVSSFSVQRARVSLRVSHWPWKGAAVIEQQVIDADHDLETVKTSRCPTSGTPVASSLKGQSVVLFTIRPLSA